MIKIDFTKPYNEVIDFVAEQAWKSIKEKYSEGTEPEEAAVLAVIKAKQEASERWITKYAVKLAKKYCPDIDVNTEDINAPIIGVVAAIIEAFQYAYEAGRNNVIDDFAALAEEE